MTHYIDTGLNPKPYWTSLLMLLFKDLIYTKQPTTSIQVMGNSGQDTTTIWGQLLVICHRKCRLWIQRTLSRIHGEITCAPVAYSLQVLIVWWGERLHVHPIACSLCARIVWCGRDHTWIRTSAPFCALTVWRHVLLTGSRIQTSSPKTVV